MHTTEIEQHLYAVLLVTRSRAGPKLVVHYPPEPAAWSAKPEQQQEDHRIFDSTLTENSGGSTDSEAELYEDDSEGSLADSREDDLGSTSGDTVKRRKPRPRRSSNSRKKKDGGQKYSTNAKDEEIQEPQTQLFGYSVASIAKLLSPSSREAWHKRRFELGLEGLYFLGCPIFERKDGGWGYEKATPAVDVRSGPTQKDRKHASRDLRETQALGKMGRELPQGQGAADTSQSSSFAIPLNVNASATSDKGMSISVSTASSSSASHSVGDHHSLATSSMEEQIKAPGPTASEHLSMFHVVLVLRNPPPLQHQRVVKCFYDHIVKKLVKPLAHLQKREAYIAKECKGILKIREGSKNGGTPYPRIWSSIATVSSLAASLANLFTAIRESRTANLQLGPSLVDLSLQLPQPISTAMAPVPGRSQNYPGLPVRSFDPFEDSSADENLGGDSEDDSDVILTTEAATHGGLDEHSAILLLESASEIAGGLTGKSGTTTPVRSSRKDSGARQQQETGNGTPDSLTTPLLHYLHHTKPNKSLHQLSQSARPLPGLSLSDIELLSLHLIYWRRAHAIPPLHPGNTYVVSPNADMAILPKATKEFEKRFRALPSLLTMLGKLSSLGPVPAGASVWKGGESNTVAGPQPWAVHIPSTDHKPYYMDMLAWLMRGGWITQLRTFAWVRVSAQVKARAARKAEAEERRAEAEIAKDAAAATAVTEDEDSSEHEAEELLASSESRHRRGSSESSAGPKVQPLHRPNVKVRLFPPRPVSETGSVSSGRTAVPIGSLKNPGKSVSKERSGSSESREVIGGGKRGSGESGRSRVEASLAAEKNADIDTSGFETTIILSPHKATQLESKWLEQIGQSLVDDQAREFWPRLLKYFDGKHALEEIAIRENLKRKVVNPVLMKLTGPEGILMTVQHW